MSDENLVQFAGVQPGVSPRRLELGTLESQEASEKFWVLVVARRCFQLCTYFLFSQALVIFLHFLFSVSCFHTVFP